LFSITFGHFCSFSLSNRNTRETPTWCFLCRGAFAPVAENRRDSDAGCSAQKGLGAPPVYFRVGVAPIVCFQRPPGVSILSHFRVEPAWAARLRRGQGREKLCRPACTPILCFLEVTAISNGTLCRSECAHPSRKSLWARGGRETGCKERRRLRGETKLRGLKSVSSRRVPEGLFSARYAAWCRAGVSSRAGRGCDEEPGGWRSASLNAKRSEGGMGGLPGARVWCGGYGEVRCDNYEHTKSPSGRKTDRRLLFTI
jgi:hypothetical protein